MIRLRPITANHKKLVATLESPRFYLYCILGFLLVLLLWMAIAHVDRVVRIEGKIIPAGRSQQIQHLEGGILRSVNTTEGAHVRRGDILLTVDSTRSEATLIDTRTKLLSQRARAVRLEAEVQGRNTLAFPPELAQLPVAKDELQLFTARRRKLEQEVAVHTSAIAQRSADIDEAGQRKIRLTSEVETAHQRVELEKTMAARGAASRMEVLEAQSREQRLNTEIGEATAAIPKLMASISEEHAHIEAIKADFNSQSQSDYLQTTSEIDRLKQSLTMDTDRMRRTDVRAPVDGVVNRIDVNTVGGVIRAGENLIELIPQSDEILIEGRVNPRDRGYLHSGLEANIRVSAFDAGELGILKGQVTEVGADSISDAHTEPYYQVMTRVKMIPDAYLQNNFIPGMTVTVDVVTGRRTILAYLLSPVTKFTYNMFKDPR